MQLSSLYCFTFFVWCKRIHRHPTASSSVPIWLDDVSCSSLDTTLVGCSHSQATSDCNHSEDVAISCASGKYLS